MMTIVRHLLLLNCMLQGVMMYTSLYSEVIELGGTCYPHDTCSEPRPDDEDNLWSNKKCECGQHCIRYRTCCPDSSYVRYVTYISTKNERCQNVATISEKVIMVSKCSSRWRQTFIRDRCERLGNSLRDPMAVVPVTSLLTGTTYKNYFCAMCNYDRVQATPWNIVADYQRKNINRSELMDNLHYNSVEHSWGYIQNDPDTCEEKFQEVNIMFQIPQMLTKIVKKCYSNMVSDCSLRSSNDLFRKCKSYYLPVKLATGKKFSTYRNIHCALCNNVSLSQDDEDICTLEYESRRKKPPMSFAILFDVNQKDGNKVGQKSNCQEGQLYDPFFQKCRTMKCALPGYILKDGKCVES